MTGFGNAPHADGRASRLVWTAGVAVAVQARGDVKWRFEVGGQYILQPPAVAPDGSVAVVGSSGRLYSLTPDGALRWSVPSVGGEGGSSFIGPDGTSTSGSASASPRSRRTGRFGGPLPSRPSGRA